MPRDRRGALATSQPRASCREDNVLPFQLHQAKDGDQAGFSMARAAPSIYGRPLAPWLRRLFLDGCVATLVARERLAHRSFRPLRGLIAWRMGPDAFPSEEPCRKHRAQIRHACVGANSALRSCGMSAPRTQREAFGRGRTLVSLKAPMRRLPSWRHRWAMRPAVGDRAGGARRNSDARRTPVERKKQDRGQRRGEREEWQ